MRTIAGWVLCLSLVCATACGPKTVPVPVVSSAPRFPEFLQPVVPAALAGSIAAESEARAWEFLQAGDFKSAERELSAALKASPDFFAA